MSFWNFSIVVVQSVYRGRAGALYRHDEKTLNNDSKKDQNMPNVKITNPVQNFSSFHVVSSISAASCGILRYHDFKIIVETITLNLSRMF